MHVDITSNALTKLKHILEENKASSTKFRIFLAGIG